MSGFSLIEKQLNERIQLLEDRRIELQDLVVDITEAERDRVRQRAAKGMRGFWFFAKKVFPEYFTYPFCRLHKDIIKLAFEKKRFVDVIAAPPEHGKTTLLRIFKIWAAIYGYYHYIIKVCETKDLSELDLASIRLEFEQNPRLKFLYGDLRTPGNWEESQFAIASTKWNKFGTFFEAFAFGIPPTGRIWKHFRPDFCDIDDLENFRKSSNINISKEKLQFINNDIIPRVSEKGHIIWFGNNARKTMALSLIIEMKKEERIYEYPAFRVHIYPAWNKAKGKAAWHQRYKYNSEEEMRIALAIGMMTWLGNYMQNPIVPEGGVFKRAGWQKYKKLPRDVIGVIRCDPASGKKNCFKVAVVLLYSKTTRKFYCPAAYVRQSDWEPYFQSLYDLYERFEDQLIRIDWESNFYQDQYLKFRELYPSVKDKPELPINPVEIKSNKDIDIITLAIPYEYGKLMFSEDFDETNDGQEARTQLLGYPDYSYVDFPDALSRAYKTLFQMFAGYLSEGVGGREHYESLGKIRTTQFR